MSGVKGFKPIASKKDKGFIGTFDGQFHAIKGLRVEYEKKYAGLFGYVGNQDDQAYIKDVALLDCYVTGQQNVGALAGVNYGTITGCVVTGEVKCLDLSNSHTAGGICGKLKEGEGPIVGHVEDCYINADVSAPYDAGGVARHSGRRRLSGTLLCSRYGRYHRKERHGRSCGRYCRLVQRR